ncbi:hypothetical protein [Methanoculleus sp. 10]|uniref:hypothetical protein n=1 Tax=Methanoculleus sp. 10 TaxID=430615 RepID=UPI0025D18760|nr:hypothetical protein [Methanoculleus sp. 10]
MGVIRNEFRTHPGRLWSRKPITNPCDRNDQRNKNRKLINVVGVICGLSLCFLWVAVLIAILFAFFAEPNAMGVFTVTFPLMPRTWLTAGTLLFFVALGYYLFAREEMPETELLQSGAVPAASTSGFLLWLVVLFCLGGHGGYRGVSL